MSYALTCCSTADLTAEHFAARDIQYTCFHFTMDGASAPLAPSDEGAVSEAD